VNFPFFVARRYFRSKDKRNFISVISNISMGGVAIGSMALIVVLSVFNGLEDLLRSLYGTFDPDLKVELTEGKSFENYQELMQQINAVEGVVSVVDVIEDYAYVKYRNSEMAVRLKGVGKSFLDQGRLEESLVEGSLTLRKGDTNFAIIGRGIQYALNIDVRNEFERLKLHYVKDLKMGLSDPTRMINQRNINVGGVFALEKSYDETYIFAPIDFVEELLSYSGRRTSLEIDLEKGANHEEVQENIKTLLGNGFRVLNSDEQHESLLKAVKIEKLFVYVVFTFIIAVASFNIFFSLSMLAIEKKKDISVLFAMGATNTTIKRIFLYEGSIIAFSGAIVGLTLGTAFCILQQEYGLISMGMDSSIILDYPIKMKAVDFLVTGLCIVTITFVASFRPAKMASRYNDNQNLH